MAALQSIRKHGVLILIIVSFALILFIVPNDFWQYITSRDANTIAEINGDKVGYDEYQKALNYHENYLRVATGATSFTEQESDNLRNYAWNDILQDYLFKKNINKTGISISEDEMEDLMYGSNIHNIIIQQQMFTDPNTGTLDTATVKRFFAQAETNDTIAFVTEYWKKMINTDRLNTKYNSLISKAFYTPTAISKMEYYEINTKYNLELLAKDYKNIPDDSIKLNDEEIKKYYENNLYKFTNENELRKFEYVMFDVIPSAEDTLNAKKEIEKYYEEFSKMEEGSVEYAMSKSELAVDTNFISKNNMPLELSQDFFDSEVGTISDITLFRDRYSFTKLESSDDRPDSVQLSVIILSTNDSTTIEQCRHQADSLKELAESGKQDFTVLALMYSADDQSKQRGGDWGWFKDGTNQLINNLQMNEDLFKGNKGDLFIKDIVFNTGAQGIGLFKINNLTDKSKKVKLISINKMINYSDATYQYVFSQANNFMSKSTNVEKFDSIVAKNNYIKREASVGELDNKFANMTNARDIVKWVYGVEKLGEISDVFPHDNTFIIAKVSSISKKGNKSLEEASDLIRTELIRNKKAEKFIAEMESDLSTNTTLLDLSQKQYRYDTVKNVSFDQPYLQNYGQEQKVIGMMTALPENKLSNIVQGDNAVYVFKIIEKTAAPEKENYDAEKLQSMQKSVGQIYKLSTTVEKMAKIKDYRAKFN